MSKGLRCECATTSRLEKQQTRAEDDKIKVKQNLVWQLCRQRDRDGYDRTFIYVSSPKRACGGLCGELFFLSFSFVSSCQTTFLPACHCWRFNRINPAAERAEKSYKLVGSWIASSCSPRCFVVFCWGLRVQSIHMGMLLLYFYLAS